MAANTGLLSPTATSNPATTTTSGKPVDYTSQLNTLYKNTFGRDAEQAGVKYYQDQLANGRSLQSVADELKNSDEYKLLQQQADTATTAVRKPVATAKAVGYKPTMQTVSDKSTVQNQLANITGTGSALNTMAETAAVKSANRRGLLSSSIAVGAAQDSVLKNALPIAQQDASTNATADVNNAQFSNASAQFLANAQNTADLTNVNAANSLQQVALQGDIQKQLQRIQADTSLSVADKQIKSQQLIAANENTNKLQLQQIDADTKKALSVMDSDSRLKLAEVDAGYKQLLQTNISAANMYAQYAQALASISTSTNMDAGAKQAAADNQLAALQAGLRSMGAVSGLDLSKYFESAGTAAQPPAAGGAGTAADLSGRPGMNGSLTEFG